MIMRLSDLRTAALAAVLFMSATAGAQQAILERREQNGIAYVTGGVGTEQQDAMRRLGEEGYALQLVFAEQGTGAYLANVHVTIVDRTGRTLLDTVADGPAMYARVPRGEYRVSAEYRGRAQTRNVHAAGSSPTVIYWPQEPGSEPAAAGAAR